MTPQPTPPKPVTIKPRYSRGQVIETNDGKISRISEIKAHVIWTTEGPLSSIEYCLTRGKVYDGTVMETNIERLVSNS
jgi:hypothetical protein